MTLVGRVAESRRASLREGRQRAASRRPIGFETLPASRGASPAGRRSGSNSIPLSALRATSLSPSSRRPSRRFSFRPSSRRANSIERSHASSESEDRTAAFLGTAARLVNLTGQEERHNGEHGLIISHDVAAGHFLVMLSGGQRVGIKPQNVEVLSTALDDEDGADTIVAAIRRRQLTITGQTDADVKAMASAQLQYDSAKLLLGSPCAFRGGSSPAAKLTSAEAVDQVPWSLAEKDRPPRNQQLTPWEIAMAESALQTSPLLKRPQWPPRQLHITLKDRDEEQVERSTAPAASRPPSAQTRHALRYGNAHGPVAHPEAHAAMLKEAIKVWVDSGMPIDV